MEIRDLAKEAVLIPEDATYKDAIVLMVRKQTNSLLVVNEDGELVGEVNVSDLLEAIVPPSADADTILEELENEESFHKAVKNSADIPVCDFMTTDIQPVHIDDSLITIATTAIAHQTAHIPVIDHDEHPIGFISRRGLKHILANYLGIKDT